MSSVGMAALSSANAAFLQENGLRRLTILYTNDTHSRIDPFPAGHPKFAGMGGYAARATLIDKVRAEGNHVLLLDAGDIVQGTPFFNMYGGEPEFRLMSDMGYDASTLGNHEFDNGVEGLAKQLHFAKFDFVNSNYDLSDTALAGKVRKYKIFRKGGLKIGVYGLGVDLQGLVNTHLRKGVVYEDPLTSALRTESFLKNEQQCDLVICLSHLGFSYAGDKISDKLLAPSLLYTDLVIGGHTHTFLKEPEKFVNKHQKEIYVTQVGWGGVILGRFDYLFDKKNKAPEVHYSMAKILI